MCVTPGGDSREEFCMRSHDNPRSRTEQEREQLSQGYITKRRPHSPALTPKFPKVGALPASFHTCTLSATARMDES